MVHVEMHKRVILILGLLVSVLAVLWFGHLLGSRKRETTDSPSRFRIDPLDERSKAFLLERDTKWFSKDGVDFALSDVMRAAGLVPSVRSLTDLLASSTPAYFRWKLYRWLRPRKSIAMDALANIKEGYCELATLDNTIAKPTLFVSDDGHVGLLWTGTNAVIVFQDAASGLQYTRYRVVQNQF